MKHWFLQVLIAIDQLVNAILGGWADETLSSRCWRWHINGVTSIPRYFVDALFFFDTHHCQSSFESERVDRHLPPELRHNPDDKSTSV